uniref:Tetraspanin n=1 Tax=Anisakis simplex TaxID=6269 RepID=A0A0M3KFP3_ANISI
LDKDFASNLEKLAESIHHEKLNVLAKVSESWVYQASLWVLVAVGALLFLVGFLGCCGAMCESTLLLSLYFVIVLIVTVIELGALIFAMTSKGDFNDALQKLLSEAAKKEDFQKNMKPIEDLFNCCGATPETKGKFSCDQSKSTGQVVIIIAFILFVIELFALISTCILCRAFRERTIYYYA